MAKVLLLDDEEVVLRCVKRLLVGQHECTTVSDPRRALALLAEGEVFDVIFCDLRLRDMSGCDFAEALRSTYPEQSTRLVMMSGDHFCLQECHEKCRRLVLEKPFTIDEMATMIERVMANAGPGAEHCHQRPMTSLS